MLNNNFVANSFTDGLLYKPSDINALVESSLDETLKFLKVKLLVEKIEITNEAIFEETLDALCVYKEKVSKTVKNENQKQSLLTEITNLMLGILKFVSPYVVRLIGWLAGLVVNTKTFGKAAISVTNTFKSITPDSIKKAFAFAKDNYQKADAAFQNIASTVNKKVQDAFKGSNEKPPLIDANAIKKAQDNILKKIQSWPYIGKVFKWIGKLIPGNAYLFLSIVALSIFAMYGSFGCAVILVFYGATTAAKKLVEAGKETGAKVADKAAQGIEKAQGGTPPAQGEAPQASAESDPFADLDNLINAEMGTSSETPQEQTTLTPELEDMSGKWATKLKASIDKGEKDNAITKIKAATEHLVKNKGIEKEQVKPFINTVAKKASVADDIKDALISAITDLGIISFKE